MSYKCVVCDFDGTLADTLQQAVRILNGFADEHGFRTLHEADLPVVREMTLPQFIKYMGIPKWKLPRLLLAGRSKLAEEIDQIQPIPGMASVLHTLRGNIDSLGVLTSNSEQNVSTFARNCDMEVFDFISSVPKLSGKAKYLKSIMRTLSLNADEILFLGDETRDIKAARKASVPSVAVTWGFNTAEALSIEAPDYLIHRPEELLEVCFPEL